MSARRRRLLVAAAFVAVWAALASGCGEEPVTEQQYGSKLRAAMADLEEAYGEAGAAVDPGANGARAATASVAQTVERLRTSQLALRDAGNRLAEIAPPDELADDHEALVAGVRDMADAVDLLIRAQQVADRDPKRAAQLARRFATDESFGAVEAAASRIESAGVDAGL